MRKHQYWDIPDYVYKIILVGDSGVGKSCLLSRFVDGTFYGGYTSTVGIDFKVRTLEIDGKLVKFQIWDTAGQERYKSIVSVYYRNIDAVLLVYDSQESYNNIAEWMQEVERYNTSPLYILICAKSDKNIDIDDTKYTNIPHRRCSALEAEGIDNIFRDVGKMLLSTSTTITVPEEALQRDCCTIL